jgi:hypothetical protein
VGIVLSSWGRFKFAVGDDQHTFYVGMLPAIKAEEKCGSGNKAEERLRYMRAESRGAVGKEIVYEPGKENRTHSRHQSCLPVYPRPCSFTSTID